MMIISNGTRSGSWHTGEDMICPREGPVLTFQVDGHESEWLIGVIRAALEKEGGRIRFTDKPLTPIL